MSTPIDVKVDEARSRLERTGARRPDPADDDDKVVLVSFRVPRSVRDEVHRAAATSGTSLQAWLQAVVHDATEATLTPEGRLAAEMARNLRSRLSEALDDGRYEALAAADPDPDLI